MAPPTPSRPAPGLRGLDTPVKVALGAMLLAILVMLLVAYRAVPANLVSLAAIVIPLAAATGIMVWHKRQRR